MTKLKAKRRKIKGKKVKQIRKDKQVPCVVYNSDGNSTSIQISDADAMHLVKKATTTTIVEIQLGEKKINSIIKEVQKHPVTGELQHISFFEIKPNQVTTFHIPFNLIGTAPAVKNSLGILFQIIETIAVQCKLKDLVPFFEIDISNLEKPGDTIRLSEVDIPDGITLLHKEDKNKTIVTISTLQKIIEVEKEDEEEKEADEEENAEKNDEENTEESKEEKTGNESNDKDTIENNDKE